MNLERQQEVVQNFKEHGYEYFKGKRYSEALGFYTQGMEAKAEDGRLREALLLNRAACNLELRASPSAFCLSGYLENYGSVLRECATIIATNTGHNHRFITAWA